MPIMNTMLLLASLCIALAQSHSIEPPPSHYGTIKFQSTGHVTKAIFDHPPINLLDKELISDLHDFMQWLQPSPSKPTPKVVIFTSSDPDYFLAHTDVRFLSGDPDSTASIHLALDIAHLLVSTTSTVFIASINGRANGLGNELAMQMDMRFAGPNAKVVQFENSIGLAAAGGGNLFIPPAIGRAKAMEYLLGALPFDCRTGKETGLFNECFGDGVELEATVEGLAERIALFPQHSLNNTKVTLNEFYPTLRQQQGDLERLLPLAALPEERRIVGEFLRLSGNQTKSRFELDIPESILEGLYNYTATDSALGVVRGFGQEPMSGIGSWGM